MTILEKIKFEEDWLSKVNLTKENVRIAIDSIKATALASQPSEDCISREAVKDMLTAEWTKYMPMELDMNLSFVLEKISELPSVTPKAKWIPCSERLPEKQDCYLVTTKWKGSYSGDVYIETNMAVYKEKQKEWDCNDVIAWMPLPPSYQGE